MSKTVGEVSCLTTDADFDTVEEVERTVRAGQAQSLLVPQMP